MSTPSTPSYIDVLDSLRDIHEPPLIAPFDPTWMWLFGVVFLSAVLLVFFWWRRWKRRHAYFKRWQMIYDNFLENQNTGRAIEQMNSLLRAVCAQSHPESLALFGKDWLVFLNDAVSQEIFDDSWSMFLYDPRLHIQNDQNYSQTINFLKLGRLWLKKYGALGKR